MDQKPKRVRSAQRGQAYVEFVIVLPLLLLLVSGVIVFGQYLYVKLAVEAAAWSGVRHATATLDPGRGRSQAFRAAKYTLEGFGMDIDQSHMQYSDWGQWGRGVQVRTTVCYPVTPFPVPFADLFVPAEMCASKTLPVERWQSAW